jgi:hypothetical protein
MKLVQLIYVSQRTRPNDETAMQDLRSIARSAGRRNNEADISGHLLANDAYFVQVLEGRSAALMSCFARISADRHHRDIQIKAIRLCEQRLFPVAGLHISDLTGPYISEALAAAGLPWLQPQMLDADHIVQLASHAAQQGPMLTDYKQSLAQVPSVSTTKRRLTDLFPWRARA